MTVLDLIEQRRRLQARIALERDPRRRAVLEHQLRGINDRLAALYAILMRRRERRAEMVR